MTLGSPLAIRTIAATLGRVGNPTPGAWLNARDRQDIVALYPLDGRYFPVTPGIDNHDTVDNTTPNHHSIGGYLNDPSVAATIHAALTS